MFVLETYSGSIKRVCRSTLAAESNGFLMGVEAGEYVRALLMEFQHPNEKFNALERDFAKQKVLCMTDAKSLESTLNKDCGQPTDKRDRILVAQIKELLGENNYEDDDEAYAHWLDTSQMLADVLTKIGCEREPLLCALYEGAWQLSPTAEAQAKKAKIREGFVEVSELKRVMGGNQTESLIGEYDSSGDGVIDQAEFLAMMCPPGYKMENSEDKEGHMLAQLLNAYIDEETASELNLREQERKEVEAEEDRFAPAGRLRADSVSLRAALPETWELWNERFSHLDQDDDGYISADDLRSFPGLFHSSIARDLLLGILDHKSGPRISKEFFLDTLLKTQRANLLGKCHRGELCQYAHSDEEQNQWKRRRFEQAPRPRHVEAPDTLYVLPTNIRFCHDTVAPDFQDGRSILQGLWGLMEGEIQLRDLPEMQVVFFEDRLHSLSNRRLCLPLGTFYSSHHSCPSQALAFWVSC
eukprot:g23345.t1